MSMLGLLGVLVALCLVGSSGFLVSRVLRVRVDTIVAKIGGRDRRGVHRDPGSLPSSRVRRAASSNFDSGKSLGTMEGVIDLLYDGECPICMMEVEFLKKRDLKSRIRFTDLRDPTYNPADHGNVTFEEGMRKLRAVLPDGTVAMGVEVFRKTYKAIGLGWVFELTNLPLVGKVADNLYDVWAENRLRLTGRGELADILKARAQEIKEMDPIEDCEEECGLDYSELP